jgi:AAA15 family ATPase/GTPase
MLLEFAVENFRSFRDRQEISLLATSDKSLPENISMLDGTKDEPILNSAVIYGPNASGKSNLIIAISLLRNLVLLSHNHQKGIKLNHQPFAFDPDCEKRPTIFDISFIKECIEYRYHLAFDRERIVEESLHHYPHGKKALIFSRTGQGYEFTKDQKDQETITRLTLENTLYLSNSVKLNYKGTLPAFEWFQNDLMVLETTNLDPLVNKVIERMNHDRKMKEMVLKAMAIADLGIVGTRGKVRAVPPGELTGKLPPQLIGMMTESGTPVLERELKFTHAIKGKDGKEARYDLNYVHESEGTRRLFAIVGPIIDSLVNGKTIVIDELDIKLHSKLSAWIVEMFHSPEQNRKGAQLIFNTHDQKLLDLSVFRRDQIWFTERDEGGRSALFSLAEFGERKDRDVQKAYELGRYGAVPFIPAYKVIK